MTELSLESQLRLAPGVLCQELEGEAVMLHLDRGFYYGLDPVGSTMLRWMETRDLEGVAAAVEEQYEVSPERCRADLLRLARQMLGHGLLELQEPGVPA